MTSRQRTHDAARIAQGWRRVPVWLDPETLIALDIMKRLMAKKQSEQSCLRWAIRQAALSLAEAEARVLEIITPPT